LSEGVVRVDDLPGFNPVGLSALAGKGLPEDMVWFHSFVPFKHLFDLVFENHVLPPPIKGGDLRWAWSETIGFAWKQSHRSVGVMEYWSIGIKKPFASLG
jgi:hypothetical protein